MRRMSCSEFGAASRRQLQIAILAGLSGGGATWCPAQTLTTLFNFNGANGAEPRGTLVFGRDGAMFGTTLLGGNANLGTVFEFAPATSQLTPIKSFNGGGDGATPFAGLSVNDDGEIFGVAERQGPNNDAGGRAFRIDPISHAFIYSQTWTSFYGNGMLAPPTTRLNGSVYMTARNGGDQNQGTITRLRPTGEVDRIVTFASPGPSGPSGGLSFDSAGNMYGISETGGANEFGTLYRVNANSSVATTLFSFTNASGSYPHGPLLDDGHGNFFGSLFGNGATGWGSIFRYNVATGVMTTLAHFDSANGGGPQGGLIADSDGNLFGLTALGGANDQGTVFKYNALTGTIVTVATFNTTNGSTPSGELTLGPDGTLYGVTRGGGTSNKGTIFKVTDAGYVLPTIQSAWVSPGGGSWSTAANWSAGVPDSNRAVVTFGLAATENADVVLDVERTVGKINFDNPNAIYSISGARLNLDVQSRSAEINVLAGSHVITSPVSVHDDVVIDVAQGAGLTVQGVVDAASHTVTKSGAGDVVLASLTARVLDVQMGKVLLTGSAKVNALSMSGTPDTPTATLDIYTGALVIAYANHEDGPDVLSDTQQRIVVARGDLDPDTGMYPYDGAGITSSAFLNPIVGFNQYAVAAIDNADLDAFNGGGSSYTTFAGQNVDADAILICVTYAGDANLDGKIDSADYSLINRGFVGTIPNVGWLSGDFNLDGVINATDYSIIDFGYLRQGSQLAFGLPVSVPEPGAALIAAALGGIAFQRRRRAKTKEM